MMSASASANGGPMSVNFDVFDGVDGMCGRMMEDYLSENVGRGDGKVSTLSIGGQWSARLSALRLFNGAHNSPPTGRDVMSFLHARGKYDVWTMISFTDIANASCGRL